MPKFTLEFHRYIERYGTDKLSLTGENVYPLYDSDHRGELNRKIIDRFYMREIGFETPEIFSFRFKRKLNEVMPYFNQLYESEAKLAGIDQFITAKTKNTSTVKNSQDTTSESTSETNSDSTSGSRNVTSTTPQTMLSGNGDYASGASDSTATATGATTGEDSGKVVSTGEQTASSESESFSGIPAQIVMVWRQSMLNIDLMVIDSLDELFMQIWDSNDFLSNDSTNYYGFPYFGGY